MSKNLLAVTLLLLLMIFATSNIAEGGSQAYCRRNPSCSGELEWISDGCQSWTCTRGYKCYCIVYACLSTGNITTGCACHYPATFCN
jgi:hypothetical protein